MTGFFEGCCGLIIAFILVVLAVLWMRECPCEQAIKVVKGSEKFQPGSALAHLGVFDGANQGRGANRAEEESMKAHEPPVFWNAGQVNAINAYQRVAVERTPLLGGLPDNSGILKRAIGAAKAAPSGQSDHMSARIHRAGYTGLSDAFNARALSPY